MHDAVLIQHTKSYNPDKIVKIFEDTMTSVLNKRKSIH